MSQRIIGTQQFRDLMAGVYAPVTVATTTIDGVPYGATVSSFAARRAPRPLIRVAFDL